MESKGNTGKGGKNHEQSFSFGASRYFVFFEVHRSSSLSVYSVEVNSAQCPIQHVTIDSLSQ